jgi:hypothetical protein
VLRLLVLLLWLVLVGLLLMGLSYHQSNKSISALTCAYALSDIRS